MTNIVKQAKYFSKKSHDAINQKRKYTGKPYWVHPERVAALVKSVGGSPEQQAAAWLHDTVEDTPVTIEEIEQLFGPAIASLVSDLTDVSQPLDGNRAVRKAMDRAHTAEASPEAQTVKLADLIDNTESIVKHDKTFARIYLAEKCLMLKILTKGNAKLLEMAWEGLAQGLKELDEI